MSDKPLYAEDVNYWQSGTSSPDSWLDKAKKLIAGAGGRVLEEAFVSQIAAGRSAFLLRFELDGDTFKLAWPVLPSRTGRDLAARRQAATFLYHDVKARCMSATVLGGRAAFLPFLQLPDGRSAAEAGSVELVGLLPDALRGGPRQLAAGDVVEGEWE